jgi:hypothetical protein
MHVFGQGRAPFAFCWSWGIGWLERNYPDLNFGTVNLPTFTGEPPYGRFGYNSGFGVTTTDPAKEQAVWEFYSFLMGEDYQAAFAPLRGTLPSLLALRDDPFYYTDRRRAIGDALCSGCSISEGPWPDEIHSIIYKDMWNAIIYGGSPVTQTMDSAAAECTQVMEAGDYWLIWGKDGWTQEDFHPPSGEVFINDDAETTNSTAVTLTLSARDNEGDSVDLMYIQEWKWDDGAWVIAKESSWLSYTTTYPWTLEPGEGVKYISAWFADGAGNIADVAAMDSINLIYGDLSIAEGEIVLYRERLSAGTAIVLTLVPSSGDPDLYIWKPSSTAQPDYWSNKGAMETEVISFTADL